MNACWVGRFVRAVALAGLVVLVPASVRAEEVVVFAAASLKTALDQIAAEWRGRTGLKVSISYAGSSSLARQIEQGAPADIFISASQDWMDYLDKAGLLKPGARKNLLGNRLALIAHGDIGAGVERGNDFNLADALGDERLAMAMVDSVPAGIYGKMALKSLGQWELLAPRVAQTDNVRAALALVASGEAPYGIVYVSDAVAEDRVRIVAILGQETHIPIIYPAAIVTTSTHADAAGFFDALTSPAAAAIFKAQGFEPLVRQGDG